MTKKLVRFVCFFLLMGCWATSAQTVAVQERNEMPVVIAFQVDRLGGFLTEPGNVPVEVLRRFGRALNKEWSASENNLIAASVFDIGKFSSTEFLRPVEATKLSSTQHNKAKELLAQFDERLDTIVNDCQPASQAIVVKAVFDSKLLRDHFIGLLSSNNSKIESQQKYKIETQLLPILEASDILLGALVISEHGAYGRFNIVSPDGRLSNNKIVHNISIIDFINDEPLMFFCQTHPIENASETLAQIMTIPQSATVVQMVASAGLDFEKDILANSARESILYANLQPTGDGGLPDIRFVAPVPEIAKLIANLPKFKTLCMQTGVFVNSVTEGNIPLAKLSYFMFPNLAIYVGLVDNFLVIATSQKNLTEEFAHINSVKLGKKVVRTIPPNLKRFWRIRSSDFNQQLQNLLQSPLLSDKGIPPVSNLKFMENLGNLEIFSTSTPELIEFIFNLPIISVDKSAVRPPNAAN